MTDQGIGLAMTTLVVEIIFLSYLEKKLTSTWVTPFTVLSLPYLIVSLLAFFFADSLGFVSLYSGTLWIWTGGLGVFWITGLTLTLKLGSVIRKSKHHRPVFLWEDSAAAITKPLVIIVAIIVAIGTISGIRLAGGIEMIGSAAFRSVAGRGLIGHASVFGMILTVLLIGTMHSLRSWKTVAIGFLLMLALLYGVKSWVFMPLTAGLLYRLSTRRLKLSLIFVTVFAAAGFALFFITYLVQFAAQGANLFSWREGEAMYTFLLQHFFAYLFAGILGQSEAMRIGLQHLSPGNPQWVFASVVNIFNFSFGSSEFSAVVFEGELIRTGAKHGEVSNVLSLFGNLFYHLGGAGMILYTAGLSLVTYLFFLGAYISRNCWLACSWCFLAALLAFGWFDLYFYTLTAIEVPVFGMLLAFSVHRLNRYSKQRFVFSFRKQNFGNNSRSGYC